LPAKPIGPCGCLLEEFRVEGNALLRLFQGDDLRVHPREIRLERAPGETGFVEEGQVGTFVMIALEPEPEIADLGPDPIQALPVLIEITKIDKIAGVARHRFPLVLRDEEVIARGLHNVVCELWNADPGAHDSAKYVEWVPFVLNPQKRDQRRRAEHYDNWERQLAFLHISLNELP
jgi:hypothetical protein